MTRWHLAAVAVLLAAAAAAAQNPQCSVSGTALVCPLLTGIQQYQIPRPGAPDGVNFLKLTNSYGYNVQINQITATAVVGGLWGEYCAYRNVFATQQPSLGIGEVGCQSKNVAGAAYPPLEWDGTNTALAVNPGDIIFIQGYFKNPDSSMNYSLSFTVASYVQSAGVLAARCPHVDTANYCNGQNQNSPWTPWQNTGSTPHYVHGALIYAVVPGGDATHSACSYILDTAGTIRWRFCAGENHRGVVTWPTQKIMPGESLVAQATMRCQAPGVWDFAAYHFFW